MIHELVEDGHEVTPAKDQHPVYAFAADGPDESFGDGVCPRRPDWGSDHTHTLGSEHVIETVCELRVSVADEPLGRDGPLSDGPRELTGLLGHPRPRRVGRHSGHVDLPRAMLDEEEHVELAKQHGVHRVEVTSQEGGRLGTEELTPGRTRSRRPRLDAVVFKMAQTVDAASRMPMPSSSPWIRR